MKTASVYRPHERNDPRHRFALGELSVAKNLYRTLAAVVGSEMQARFHAGEVVHKHLCGIDGGLSPADAVINEYVLREHVLRGSKHCIVSSYAIGNLVVEAVTNLRTRTTVLRLAQPARNKRL